MKVTMTISFANRSKYFKSMLQPWKLFVSSGLGQPTCTSAMFHLSKAEVSRKPRWLLKNANPPVEAVKTFACKVSASFHRQTASAKQRFGQTFHQLETRFLNSSQGEAGLIFAVPNIPANITPAELASAFNDTLTRLCADSQEIQYSSTSLSPDSSSTKDLLDFEHEQHPPTPSPPQMTSASDLLLPELSDSSTAEESHSTSQASTDDLLCRHGLNELQVPLLPTTRQYPTVKTEEEPLKPKQSPLDPFDFLSSLSFEGLSPYPLVTKARTAVQRATTESGVGVLDTGNKKALLRKPSGKNLRLASMDNFAKDSLLVSTPFLAKRNPLPVPKRVAKPTSHPECLRSGPLDLHRAELPRLVSRRMPTRTCTPPRAVSSLDMAHQPSRAPLLPAPSTTSNTLMEEMTDELNKFFAAFENRTEEEGMPDKATSEAHKPDPLLKTLRPIIPPRLSSRPARTTTETTHDSSLSFKNRLLNASRSAILAAANEAETSELRWFHCRT
jgi:hypothetical protein